METKELIKKYRLKAGLTQQQVADQLFVQKQTYNQYETGKRKIDTETFFKIAEIVNMNVAIQDKYHKKTKINFPERGIHLSKSYDFLFDEKNNSFDEEYKDYITDNKKEEK